MLYWGVCMDIKRLMEKYRFLLIEIKDYEESKNNLLTEYKEIQKYIQVPSTIVMNMSRLYIFYNKRCEYLQGQIQTAERLLNTLEEPYYTIMYKRYVEGKSLETVADETYYSYNTVCRKIKEAFEIPGGVGDERTGQNSEKNRSIARKKCI